MFEPRRLIVQETDPPHSFGRLRTAGERPCDGRAPEECDEFCAVSCKIARRGRSCQGPEFRIAAKFDAVVVVCVWLSGAVCRRNMNMASSWHRPSSARSLFFAC